MLPSRGKMVNQVCNAKEKGRLARHNYANPNGPERSVIFVLQNLMQL